MRAALGRSIVHEINGVQVEIPVITLDPGLEQILHKSLQTAGESGAGLEPGLAEQMHKSLEDSAQRMEMEGQAPVLLVSSYIRPWLLASFAIRYRGYMCWPITKSPRIGRSGWFPQWASVKKTGVAQ
nr:FHIPEP family type III secretion protein [Methylomonas koyamae]